MTPRILAATIGLLALADGLVGIGEPRYWEPQTALDWAAVLGWSLTLVAVGVGAWLLVGIAGRSREVVRPGVVTVGGAVTAALANLLEDGLDLGALGSVYVVGTVAAFAGLLWLAASLAVTSSRWLALVALTTALGLAAVQIGGLFLVAATWLAFAWSVDRIPPSRGPSDPGPLRSTPPNATIAPHGARAEPEPGGRRDRSVDALGPALDRERPASRP